MCCSVREWGILDVCFLGFVYEVVSGEGENSFFFVFLVKNAKDGAFKYLKTLF